MSNENEQTPWVPLAERIRYWWGHPTFNSAKEIQAAFEKHTASLRAECERLRQKSSAMDNAVLWLRERLRTMAESESWGGEKHKNYARNTLQLSHSLNESLTERDTLRRDLTAAKSQVDALIGLVKEVIDWHSNHNSPEFNGCDSSPCYWCEQAKAAIASTDPSDTEQANAAKQKDQP